MSNVAYEFDRFGGEYEAKENNVVKMPAASRGQNLNHEKISPKTMVKWTAAFLTIFVLSCSTLYNEMVLNELNNNIQTANTKLDRSRSEYIQLEMAAASRMTMEEVERYAVDVLGMQKMQTNQLLYIRTNEDDKIIAHDDSSDSVWGKIGSWFADLFA
jgi:cell division protein FtsL